METMEKKGYIFGGVFTLANRLQIIGDAHDPEVTIKQWLFIAAVTQFDTPPTITEIATYIGYSRQNAKRMASNLERIGFLDIVSDEKDSRALRLKLTEKCMIYFEKRNKRDLEFMENLFEGFDDEAVEGLFFGMKLLEKNIKRMENYEKEK